MSPHVWVSGGDGGGDGGEGGLSRVVQAVVVEAGGGEGLWCIGAEARGAYASLRALSLSRCSLFHHSTRGAILLSTKLTLVSCSPMYHLSPHIPVLPLFLSLLTPPPIPPRSSRNALPILPSQLPRLRRTEERGRPCGVVQSVRLQPLLRTTREGGEWERKRRETETVERN